MKALLYDDSVNSLTYAQITDLNHEEIISDPRKAKVIPEMRRMLERVCADMRVESYQEMLVGRTMALIQACEDLNRTKKAEGRFAIPKDAKVFHCACMLMVVENSRKLVGLVQRKDVIRNFRFAQPLRAAEESVKRFGAAIMAQGLLEQEEVGDVDVIKARMRLFMKRVFAPYPIENLALEIFDSAVNGVWFNGKSPTAVAGCAIYHVFFENCEWCSKRLRGRQALMDFRKKMADQQESHVVCLRDNFAIPQTVHSCSEAISKRHHSDEEDDI
jgi:hypothetical protein